MIATSGYLTALECIIFVFGRGSVPDPARGAYSAPPDHLAGLRGATSKGKGGEGKGKERGREGEKRGRQRTGGTRPLRKFLELSLIYASRNFCMERTSQVSD